MNTTLLYCPSENPAFKLHSERSCSSLSLGILHVVSQDLRVHVHHVQCTCTHVHTCTFMCTYIVHVRMHVGDNYWRQNLKKKHVVHINLIRLSLTYVGVTYTYSYLETTYVLYIYNVTHSIFGK